MEPFQWGHSSEDWFRVEESEALLRAIFPNWPDTDDVRPVSDVDKWLREYRAQHPRK